MKLACKPGSVQGLPLGQSFLSTTGCPMAPAAYPGAARATLSLPYLALLRMGFGVPFLLPETRWALTRSRPKGLPPRTFSVARTISPLPEPADGSSAVCSLFHFPSPHGARPLAGILPCGARTFLYIEQQIQRLPGQLHNRILLELPMLRAMCIWWRPSAGLRRFRRAAKAKVNLCHCNCRLCLTSTGS